ncbi:MAG TPA: carbohydrate kinase family protein [Clostridia bacterium]
MQNILVCGSIAYDNIMDFPGLFRDQIIPEKIDAINISFLVNSLKRTRGGTAPNIAYNLSLVGEKPIILGTAGRDFPEYAQWLNQNGVSTEYVRILDNDYTATCYITTDMSNNQITGFYPGAMSKDAEITLTGIDAAKIKMAIIAPTEPSAMVKWVSECTKLSIPYLYDPGMQIPRLSGKELTEGIMGAKIAIFNEYEYDMMIEKTGLSENDILNKVEILIQTLGSKGSILKSRKDSITVNSARPANVVDPTGAGDAYRAGLLKGYFEGASLDVMGKLASISAVYAVEHKGGTEHKYTINEFYARYRENYGEI